MSFNSQADWPDEDDLVDDEDLFPPEDDDEEYVPAPQSFPRFNRVENTAEVRSERGGCLLPGLGVGVIVLSLVILALFLPPVSLWNVIDEAINGTATPSNEQMGGLDFVELDAASPQIASGSLVISADPAALSKPFSVHIASLAPADYLAGTRPDKGWYCETDLPPNHALASSVYSLMQAGTPPGQITVQITALAQESEVPGVLGLYSWNADTQAWEFLPAQPAGSPDVLVASVPYLPRCVAMFRAAESVRTVGVALAVTDTFSADVLQTNARVYPAGLRPTVTGALQGVLAPGFETGQGYEVLPLIQNFEDPAVIDVATVQQILSNSTLREEHARQIAAFILRDQGSYAGVVIDYRDLSPDLADEYAAFIRDLATLLHSGDRKLIVVVPAPAFENNAWIPGAYHWQAIGRAADEVAITLPLDPRAFTPDGMVDKLLAWAVNEISPDKITLSLSALSVEDQGEGMVVPVTLDMALSYLGSVQLDPAGPVEPGQTITAQLVSAPGVQAQFGHDETLQTPYIRYVDEAGNTLRTMWITTPQAFWARLDKAATYQLGGIFVRDLMAPGVVPGLEEALLAYRLGQAGGEAQPFDLALQWTLSQGDSVISQEAGQPDQPYSVEIPDAGEYTLAAEVQLNDTPILALTPPAPIAVAALPAPTPTVEPTTQSTPQPTGQGTPVANAPLSAPIPVVLDGPLPTLDPGLLASATISTDFEPGVHIMELNGNSILPTGRAGLTWMKLDIAYTLGQDPNAQKNALDNVQGNGFKVLFSVTGDPDELANTDPAEYIGQYIAYVNGLAALGADGIEIWHGMNTADHWPEAMLDPTNYVRLLAHAYVAIKQANPNTMVISGGLLPTNAAGEEGHTDTIWNDDAYYTGMAEAGASQYMDCVGVRYLEGAVSPDATSGDPRGSEAIYYLPSVTDRVWNTFGGLIPVCYTGLGYLSEEGYSTALPEQYGWAQGITAAQQAQWLADAVRLNMTGGKVRLMILWNMDATTLDETGVAGGYAMLRPDGTCAACDLLAELLKTP